MITGNGTVDNFNNNLESKMYNHMTGQILTALNIQKDGGSFILRMEDCFTDVTVKLLNVLEIAIKKFLYVSHCLVDLLIMRDI